MGPPVVEEVQLRHELKASCCVAYDMTRNSSTPQLHSEPVSVEPMQVHPCGPSVPVRSGLETPCSHQHLPAPPGFAPTGAGQWRKCEQLVKGSYICYAG
jgi:hypothetical protein